MLAVRQMGRLRLWDSPDPEKEVYRFEDGGSWNVAIRIESDNTEPLMLATKLTVYPGGNDFKWDSVSEVEEP